MAGEKILVIDDTKVICTALKVILEEDGYDVDIALCGEESFEKAKLKKYDVIFVDLVMPGMDGIQTCKAIKEISLETELVLMTGHIDLNLPDKEAEFVKAGGRVYNLYKPFEVEQILEAVKRALAEKS